MRYRKRILEILIGLGLGLASATSLRFIGKVGPSEILMALATILLLKKYYKRIFSFSYDIKGFIKLYMFLSIFFIAPIMTIITISLTNYEEPTPIYIISFMLQYMLMFSLVYAFYDNYLELKKIVYTYAIIF